VEREMEEWESKKLSEMTDLIEKRHQIIERGDEELKLILNEMSEKSKNVQFSSISFHASSTFKFSCVIFSSS
jgi:hypothetical protein